MKRLSRNSTQIAARYDVVVVGSGYGGAIAASRLARCGKRVCVLERGREILTGDYPDTLSEAANDFQVNLKGVRLGRQDALFDMRVNDDMDVLVGCGLGGTSLINANVSLRPDPRVLEDKRWPKALRDAPLLETGFERAEAMLAPNPYPETTRLDKLEALKKAAEHLGAACECPPINVTFSDGANRANVEQTACTLCGNCVSGCNVGAKNTTLINYLPDAANHGAEIFTKVEVRYVKKAADGWHVFYRLNDLDRESFEPTEMFVASGIVVLGAGTLGSTEILMRSTENGLPLSDRLGAGFTGNGDVLAFGYNNDTSINGIGFDATPSTQVQNVGPCITGLIDLRGTDAVTDGMVIEEGSLPGALAPILPGIFGMGDLVFGKDTDVGLRDFLEEKARKVESYARGAQFGAVHNTQTFLVMSHDDGAGQMALKDDRLAVDWTNVAGQSIFAKVDANLEKATEATGGSYIKNPLSTALLGENLITVHPLGGCGMGESARDGVVNHKCQVFDPEAQSDNTAVHEGLYVCDGAVMPSPLGVNPLLTISAVAERAMIYLSADMSWRFDADPKADAEQRDAIPNSVADPCGVRFTEKMAGYFSKEAEDGIATTDQPKPSPFQFVLSIEVDDVEAFVNDPKHAAGLAGTVTAPALSSAPLTAADGTFNLFVTDPEKPLAKRMEYSATLSSVDGQTYRFVGYKLIKDDPGLDMWSDTTTLYVEVFEQSEDGEQLVGKGELRIALSDFLTQAGTLKGTGGGSATDRGKAVLRFASFFGRSLLEAYGPPVDMKPARPAEARRKVPLYTLEGVSDARVSTHHFTTEDKLGLSMLRFQRDDGGDAVLIIHGLTTSTDMFIMPEHKNLVSYLLDHGYDVWCLDFRMSNRHSYNLRRHRYNMDDIALFDYPPAIDLIRRHIGGERRLHVVCHCLGAVSFTMSLFGRAVDGIASVVANSVSLTPKVPAWSYFKLHVAPFFVEKVLSVSYVDPRWSEDPGWTRGRLLSKVISLFHRECDVPACHMLSFMWGTGWPALYSHKNLAAVTHERGGDLYGGTSLNYHRHVRKMVRNNNTAVQYDPANPLYARLPKHYFEHVRDIRTPVLFMTGRHNRVFADSQIECHRRMEKLVPGLHEKLVLDGYGHQDPFMGKSVAKEVFPHISNFMRRHSQ